jgi:energy-coupling factor transporter transmembrane protein EcfT
LVDTYSNPNNSGADGDPWVVWFTFFTSMLIFISLFIVASPWWHMLISTVTLIMLWLTSPSPIKKLAFILGLVSFLAIMQILFSPFMRTLLSNSLAEGFKWEDWQYLLFAVERFAWPLVVVSSFQTRLGNPATIAQLTMLLSPLEWLGFQIGKLQTLVVLSLRFMPSLKIEWDRFSRFQLFFVSGTSRKTYLQKLRFWQSIFKALISHTIHRSIMLGDLLAMRGLPSVSWKGTSKDMFLLGGLWTVMGVLFFMLDVKMILLWCVMSLWLGLVTLTQTLKIRT